MTYVRKKCHTSTRARATSTELASPTTLVLLPAFHIRLRCNAEPARARANRVLRRILRLIEHAQELFLVEHHLLSRQSRQVEERRQLDRVARACLLAHAAI